MADIGTPEHDVQRLRVLADILSQNELRGAASTLRQVADNIERRATDVQRDTARGVPEGAFIPRTAEQMIEFIGSNFDSMQADEWTDEPIPKPAGDLHNVRYSLTVHDLLSAFQWAGLLDAPTPPDGDAGRDRRDAEMFRWAIERFENADALATFVMQHAGNTEGVRIDADAAMAANKGEKA